MSHKSDQSQALPFPILIGDIGGTNARFAIVENAYKDACEPRILQTTSFATIDDAILAVLDGSPVHPRSTVLAVAGPVEREEIALTNCPWVVRPKQMFSKLSPVDILVLNDFEAQALAVVALGNEHMEKIGGGEAEQGAARVVLGPGTGLGIAGLIHARGRWIPIPSEGGHMDIGPRSPRDFEVFPHIEKLEGRISGEQILCGRGLVNTYRAIARADAKIPTLTQPTQVTAAALDCSDPVAVEALDLFITCLGRTAGDLALVFKSKGGVFLTGGIAQKIVPALKQCNFREAFEDKAPHRKLMASMPVYVITHPLAALAGLAAYARNPSLFGIETGDRRWRR